MSKKYEIYYIVYKIYFEIKYIGNVFINFSWKKNINAIIKDAMYNKTLSSGKKEILFKENFKSKK